MGGIDFSEEPGVNGNAVSTNTDTGLEDFHSRMGIRDLNGSADVNAESLSYHREFVREGNVDIPVCVLHNLDELRRHVVREENLSLYEGSVDCLCPLSGLFRE